MNEVVSSQENAFGLDIDTIIRQVDGSMAIEGMALTDEDKARIRRTALVPSKVEDVIDELVLLDKLAGLSTAWKAQFQEPYKPLDLPLEWTIDQDGLLRLDRVWICPVTCIDPSMVLPEDGEYYVTPVSMELNLKDGCLTIIITQDSGKHEITAIERTV